jgi:fatty acid desaturase
MVFSHGVLSLMLLAAAPSALAFSQPKASGSNLFRSPQRSLLQSTVAPEAPANGANAPSTWDEGVEVKTRTSLDVRINGDWYDLTGWRKAHPAGDHWIDYYDGRDATEVMDAFHSEKGRKMYQRLPKSKTENVEQLELATTPDSQTQLNFRQLRSDLEKEGFWERDMKHEATLLGIFASLVITAVLTARSVPILSTGLLGLAMTNAGWLGHDFVHGVDKYSDKLRNFVAVAAGLTPTWWSDKHNKHHALTNEQGVDEDIATDPFLYTWAPDPKQDSPVRKVQHLIFFVPFSALFALWRFDSMATAINAVEQKRTNAKQELYCLLGHYAFLLTAFPLGVWVPAVFMSGLMSALIVTPTHQSEEMFDDYQPDWVTAQFQSTRNAITNNPFSEWLWGGMQYQLEHHLFPSMPRNQYPKLRKRLQAFAADNNIPGGYRESGEFEIQKMNWLLYKKIAEADAVPGAPPTKGRLGQLGAIEPPTEAVTA